jgi:hypothetical protein
MKTNLEEKLGSILNSSTPMEEATARTYILKDLGIILAYEPKDHEELSLRIIDYELGLDTRYALFNTKNGYNIVQATNNILGTYARKTQLDIEQRAA